MAGPEGTKHLVASISEPKRPLQFIELPWGDIVNVYEIAAVTVESAGGISFKVVVMLGHREADIVSVGQNIAVAHEWRDTIKGTLPVTSPNGDGNDGG